MCSWYWYLGVKIGCAKLNFIWYEFGSNRKFKVQVWSIICRVFIIKPRLISPGLFPSKWHLIDSVYHWIGFEC